MEWSGGVGWAHRKWTIDSMKKIDLQIATVLDTWWIIMSLADVIAEPPKIRHLQHVYHRDLSHSDTTIPLAHSQSRRGLRALGRSHCHFSDPFLTTALSLQTTPKPAAWTAMAGVIPSLSSKVESLVGSCGRYMLQDLLHLSSLHISPDPCLKKPVSMP